MRRWKVSLTLAYFFNTESLHHYRFATCEQAKQVIVDCIEVFYNPSGIMRKSIVKRPLTLLASITQASNNLQHDPNDLPAREFRLRLNLVMYRISPYLSDAMI